MTRVDREIFIEKYHLSKHVTEVYKQAIGRKAFQKEGELSA